MDRHDNLAVSVNPATAQREVTHVLNNRDQRSVHRLFRDLRDAMGTSSRRIVALPHP